MGRHQIAIRLAKHFYNIWVNPAHHWRHMAPRFFVRSPSVRRVPGAASLFVYQPEAWLPMLFHGHALSRMLLRARIKRAKRVLRRMGCRRFVLYLWRPQLAEAALAAKFDLVCYHIADEYSFSEDEVPVDSREAALIAAVDRVFVTSDALMKKKGHINPSTFLVPNGVDFSAYSTPMSEPADLRGIQHPRVGYTGYLKKHVDWELLEWLAAAHANWSFVFVGPMTPEPAIDAAVRRLRNRANVHFLGPRTTRELSAYPQHFDVCIMPYRRTAYTQYINPLKLNEYLASGRPVVSSRIAAIAGMENLVIPASSREEWSAALTTALDHRLQTSSAAQERQALAREHDWDARVDSIARLIIDGLDR